MMSDKIRRTPRPRRRRRRRRILPLLLVLLLAAMAGLWLLRHPGGRVKPPELPEWVTVDLLPVNEYSRPGTELNRVNGIVVHYVGNPGTTAQNNRDYFAGLAQTGETSASSHFVIGLEGEVIQCVPLDEIAYCSNHRNEDTISIECCHPDGGGQFTPETYDALVRLTAFLADYYGLGQEQIIRHYDVTGKLCPLYYVEHEEAWAQFRDDVFRTETGSRP